MYLLRAIAIVVLLCPYTLRAQVSTTKSDTVAYAYYEKGNKYLLNDDYAQALAEAKKGLMFSKGHLWCNFLAGEALVGLKQYDKALPYLKGVQGRLSDNKDLYRSFIAAEYGLNDLDQVKFYSGIALVHFPDDVYFSTVRVDALDKTQKFADADEVLQKLFAARPGDDKVKELWDEHNKTVSSYYQSINSMELAQSYQEKIGWYPGEDKPVKKTMPVTPPPATTAANNIQKTNTTATNAKTAQASSNTAAPKMSAPQQTVKPETSYASADTVNKAKKLRAQGKNKEAREMLMAYTTKHTKDAIALWVYGETELWMGHIDRALKLYKRAVDADKENDYLLLDYASVLNTAGKVKEYKAILAQLESKGKKYCAADLINAQRAYWDGDYKLAEKLLEPVWAAEPANAKALALYKDIKIAKGAWIKAGIGYMADNQPVKNTMPMLSAGIYAGKMFAPQIMAQANAYNYSTKHATLYAAEFANNATLPKAHLQFTAGAGVFADANGGQQSPTYRLGVQQQLNHLSWQLVAEQKPFVYTPASIDTNVIAQHTAASVYWERGSSFMAKAGAEAYFFDGGNRMDIVYGWVLSPELRSKNVGLRVGYSYGYTNATQNNYVNDKPLATILADPSKPITGTYNKFFTPNDQKVNSLLVSASLKAGHADFGVSVDYGFSASLKNPYLYVDKDGNGTFFINKGYSVEAFNPYGVHVHLDLHLSPTAAMTLRYDYRHTWFFDVQTADLGFKFNIVNGKKSRKK